MGVVVGFSRRPFPTVICTTRCRVEKVLFWLECKECLQVELTDKEKKLSWRRRLKVIRNIPMEKTDVQELKVCCVSLSI